MTIRATSWAAVSSRPQAEREPGIEALRGDDRQHHHGPEEDRANLGVHARERIEAHERPGDLVWMFPPFAATSFTYYYRGELKVLALPYRKPVTHVDWVELVGGGGVTPAEVFVLLTGLSQASAAAAIGDLAPRRQSEGR